MSIIVTFFKGVGSKETKIINNVLRKDHEYRNDLTQGIVLSIDDDDVMKALSMPKRIMTFINKLKIFWMDSLTNKVNSCFWHVNRIGYLPILFYLFIRKYSFFCQF